MEPGQVAWGGERFSLTATLMLDGCVLLAGATLREGRQGRKVWTTQKQYLRRMPS